MRPTIVHVARIAEVSPTTVSRIINKEPRGYSEKTKQKVLKVVRDLNYLPDGRGRSLRGLKTHVIGFMIPNFNLFFHDIARTFSNLCASKGYGVLVCSSEDNLKRQIANLDYLVHQAVDGVVIISEQIEGRRVDQLIQKDIPVVVLDEEIPLTGAPAVLTDYYKAGVMATQYLIDLGHKRIAFIKGRRFVLSAKARLQGYTDTMRRNGLSINKNLIKEGDFSYESGYEATKKLLEKSGESFTAIFSCCDFTALGATACIQDMGKKVPDDYSVVGIDDISLSALTRPPLTTVAPPSFKLGRTALDIINKWPKRNKRIVYLPELVIRNSCREIVTE
jgi:LacI family transcriptional regulator